MYTYYCKYQDKHMFQVSYYFKPFRNSHFMTTRARDQYKQNETIFYKIK